MNKPAENPPKLVAVKKSSKQLEKGLKKKNQELELKPDKILRLVNTVETRIVKTPWRIVMKLKAVFLMKKIKGLHSFKNSGTEL